MARCLKCGKTCKNPYAPNWERWQLCYKHAREEHPEFYEDQKEHGVGGKYLKQPDCIPMTTPKMS